MGFWFVLFLFVALTVAGELLRPKPKFGSPQPSSLGDFQVPTAQEGRPIPVVYGTCHLKGANVVWYGDLKVSPITTKVKTGMFSSKTVTTGYKYYLGAQLALCHGQVDSLVEVRFGDKTPSYTAATVGDKLQLTINSPSLFGGNDKEGGVSGAMDFYYGTTGQTANDYLQSKLGTLPAYRGVCYAVWRQLYVGTSPYIKNPGFIVRRCPNGLGLTAGKENISGDANPACMLYEILTDTRWGLGLSLEQINTASFTSAGDALFSESLGLSMILDSASDGASILGEILRHIDGVIYTDPATGLITLKLARADYDPTTLHVFNTSNVLECEYSRGSWVETKNVVKVSYIDRSADYQTRVAQQQDLANIQGRGGEVVAESFDFRGLSNSTAANKVAARTLKTLSYPLSKVRITANRKAWALRPGSVFKLDWPPFGISGMVCRVIRISYGNLLDGKISVDAVEDIFAVASTAFSAPSGTGWTDPAQDPVAVAAQALVEVPYHMLGAEERRVMTFAARGNSQCMGYQVWTDRTGGAIYVQSEDIPGFTPTATLKAAYGKNTAVTDTTGFVVENPKDMDLLSSLATNDEWQRGVNLLQIDSEVMAWKTIIDNEDGTYTVKDIIRGVFDTLPADHSTGARVWFFAPAFAGLTDTDAYPAELTLYAKLLPYTLRSTLQIGSATVMSLATASRAYKPYPPGKVQVNGIYWPQSIYGDAVMTWAHRHRVTQTLDQKVVAQDAGSYVTTPEGNYTVKVYVGGVLKRTYSALTGTSQSYTAVNRTTDDTDGSKLTKMRIEPVNGSYTGSARDIEFYMTGLGMTLGIYLGGQQT